MSSLRNTTTLDGVSFRVRFTRSPVTTIVSELSRGAGVSAKAPAEAAAAMTGHSNVTPTLAPPSSKLRH